MEPEVLLRTPYMIEECIHRTFPDLTVQIDRYV